MKIDPKAGHDWARALFLGPALAMLIAGCEPETKARGPEARPVRTVAAADWAEAQGSLHEICELSNHSD